MTSYNKPKTISKAIESVLCQSYDNWELFIMDDHSNPETVQIIQRYLDDPRIHYFNSQIDNKERYKRTRYAALINEAIPKTSGEFLTYLTDDNIFLPDRFSKMAEKLKSESSIQVVYSMQLVRYLNYKGDVEREEIRKAEQVLKNPIGRVDHCSIMHTRNLADRVLQEFGSYWDDDPVYWYNGDAAFWKRLTNFSLFHPIPEVLDIAFKDSHSLQRLYSHLPRKLPDGLLIKAPSSATYLLEGQTRRYILPDVFELLKYQRSRVVEIPDPFLFQYPEGVPVNHEVFENASHLPNQLLIKECESQTVFFLQKGYKHPISGKKAFDDYHFKQENMILINKSKLTQIPAGDPIVQLSKRPRILPDGSLLFNRGKYYIAQSNSYHPIEKRTAEKLKLPINNPIKVTRFFLSHFTEGDGFEWVNPFVNKT